MRTFALNFQLFRMKQHFFKFSQHLAPQLHRDCFFRDASNDLYGQRKGKNNKRPSNRFSWQTKMIKRNSIQSCRHHLQPVVAMLEQFFILENLLKSFSSRSWGGWCQKPWKGLSVLFLVISSAIQFLKTENYDRNCCFIISQKTITLGWIGVDQTRDYVFIYTFVQKLNQSNWRPAVPWAFSNLQLYSYFKDGELWSKWIIVAL